MLGPPPGPQPASRRYVFDQDAIHFSGVLSLGELLARVPGVFLVRSGWVGHAEAVSYAGQGPGSVELYWDGYALDPMGLDSAGFDLGRFDLGTLRRVEVEALPTVLRVYLVTDAAGPRRARTEASFGTGDASTNSYRLRYLNRWRGGTGIGIGATFNSTSGPAIASAGVSQLNLWVKGTWMPSDRVGVEYQVSSYGLQRDALLPSAADAASPEIPAANVRRTDMFVRAFGATRLDGTGLRFDAELGSSSYSDTTHVLDTLVNQAALDVSYRGRNWSTEAWGRVRDDLTPFDVGSRFAWSPLRALTLSSAGRRRARFGGGGVSEVSAGLELRPVDVVALHGELRWRGIADSAFAVSDTAQRVRDWSGGISYFSRKLTIDATLTRHDPFSTPSLGAFRRQLPGVVTAGATVTTVSYRYEPWRSFSISGWWSNPSNDSIPFEPKHHALTRFTFESRFLPHFRRGVFDFMAQVEIESWGRGTAGATSGATLARLPGATVWNYHFQFRLVGAIVYWTMRNALFQRYALVPGFQSPRGISRFGVRWEFTN